MPLAGARSPRTAPRAGQAGGARRPPTRGRPRPAAVQAHLWRGHAVLRALWGRRALGELHVGRRDRAGAAALPRRRALLRRRARGRAPDDPRAGRQHRPVPLPQRRRVRPLQDPSVD